MCREKNDAGKRLSERNPVRVPYETSFMYASDAERSQPAYNRGGSEACLATWRPYPGFPRRKPMVLRPTLSNGLPFSEYDRSSC